MLTPGHGNTFIKSDKGISHIAALPIMDVTMPVEFDFAVD
jgi:hypothetical protein